MQKKYLLILGIILVLIALYYFLFSEKRENDQGADGADYQGNGMLPQTKNFKASEFSCKDGTPVPKQYYGNLQKLMDNLQVLRDHLGVPLVINSGYRTAAHNKQVGGATNSTHMRALAADIVAIGVAPSKVRETILQLIAQGKMHNGGLGKYATFTHYDVRNSAARW